ncbi:smad nuclear-interacting protein 1-like [Antechinus flavipes]|uniref:smad nuclear-interacting protein 1-like n=1 Tax=Antechinus flavipes TaxID=38775 RepID=UPI0022365D66|nr:smad nuclear-interacting protein 1-like [Antechinus flavipes]
MKEVKPERVQRQRRSREDEDETGEAAGEEVLVPDMSLVKQEPRSPTPASRSHRPRPRTRRGSSGSPSPAPEEEAPLQPPAWAAASRARSARASRARAGSGSRSPTKRKNKSFGRRSRSLPSKRSRCLHHPVVKVKQERESENHPRRERDERQHREQWKQEHRRERNGDRDRHHSHSNQRKIISERPSGGRNRDAQNLQEQEAEREFYNARRWERHQKKDVGGSSDENQIILQSACGHSKAKDAPNKEKPSFELSGALLEDTNMFRGVVIKYNEPLEARIPKKRWRLYPFKNDEVLPVMYIHRQSAYLLGRHRRIADIPIDHPSCSKQHAVFQYRLVEYTRADGTVGRRVRPYIIDLGSSNGTFLNNQRIEPQRYYELKEKDVLKFGFSSREYVLLHEFSDTSEVDRKEDEDEEEEEMISDS